MLHRELDTQGETGAAAALLSALAAELGVGEGQAGCVRPGVNCGGVFAMPSRPPLPPPDTKLNPNVLCAVVAAVQPEGAVVVDEVGLEHSFNMLVCKKRPLI